MPFNWYKKNPLNLITHGNVLWIPVSQDALHNVTSQGTANKNFGSSPFGSYQKSRRSPGALVALYGCDP